jgi:hypothetical protein
VVVVVVVRNAITGCTRGILDSVWIRGDACRIRLGYSVQRQAGVQIRDLGWGRLAERGAGRRILAEGADGG